MEHNYHTNGGVTPLSGRAHKGPPGRTHVQLARLSMALLRQQTSGARCHRGVRSPSSSASVWALLVVDAAGDDGPALLSAGGDALIVPDLAGIAKVEET